jgi:hypothetical protein
VTRVLTLTVGAYVLGALILGAAVVMAGLVRRRLPSWRELPALWGWASLASILVVLAGKM